MFAKHKIVSSWPNTKQLRYLKVPWPWFHPNHFLLSGPFFSGVLENNYTLYRLFFVFQVFSYFEDFFSLLLLVLATANLQFQLMLEKLPRISLAFGLRQCVQNQFIVWMTSVCLELVYRLDDASVFRIYHFLS